MALYLGEAVRILASGTDPETGLPLDPPPLSSTVEFWAPGLNPIKNIADRRTPTVPGQRMTYRPVTSDFVFFQSTAGDPWVPGKWIYRVTLIGEAFSNWEFSTFTLKA